VHESILRYCPPPPALPSLLQYYCINIAQYTTPPLPALRRPYPIRNERSAFKPLAVWGPSEGFFLINSTAVGLTRMKRSSFGLRVRVNPWVNLGERFIRVNPTDV